MLSVLPTLEEEYELEDGAEEAHVREANKSYTTLIQYTFQKSLGSEEKSLMRDLITGLFHTIQNQNKGNLFPNGAKKELENL
ncbi:hypothetical protein CEXT_109661 [Caerostris extrusa]|uniref:Uncharacterized protein n=1 Tax=Caerostris extrusa TaxID=172846 RepID=A0AAV4M9A2_CAEEX|nr:hypothetical protein CEXT_109661 [Caerostris extrusa]